MDLRTPGFLVYPSVVKLAVVGAGISGLGAARALHRDHEVVIYEAESQPGGHARTVGLSDAGIDQPVDTGFIVYNRSNYPHFTELLQQLGVSTQPSTMSFSYRDEASHYEYAGHGIRALLGGGSNLLRKRTWPLVLDLVRFYRRAPRDRDRYGPRTTLDEYLEDAGYSRSFVEHHLIPMISAIWSVDPGRSRRMPFQYVVDFFRNHGLLKLWNRPRWRTVSGGSRVYVKALVDELSARMRTDTPVLRVERKEGTVRVYTDTGSQEYDAVVLACHSDTALDLLAESTQREAEVLGSIAYRENRLTLHRDTSVLPDRRSLWGAWNYHRGPGESRVPTVTYNLSILQDLDCSPPVLITLNAQEKLQSSRILDRFQYSHPYIDVDALVAQGRYEEINGTGDVYYAGAYWFNGFHEDGLRSGIRAARALRRQTS